ncbi:outer membrane protein assembly factor BamA [Dokdonella immobilis]|uniref:Outer membrane protein assembly factor BamA n=1 Tax=Dokdonella immobilis TaxID=578942 RepID=A0A1I4ZER6_9GAMM|nr:outer membrane protein assembly factor BamA [Dokdonella immobilis]SFN48677.1 Beta-barrel assembly machine subunit BamA [Dokdonella immobilis]
MKRIAALLLLAWLSTQNAFAFDAFTVSDIRIDGLSRIAPGTVFTYLPVEKGDVLTPDRAEQAIRALYKTGFFNDVSLSRQGDILVITIVERPSISKIAIRGNKDLKDEDLRNGLKGIGLAEGETFNRLKLDSVQQELTRQYYNRGKYNVSVKTSVVNLDRNRVEVAINIAEGKPARIQHLNVVGNETFKTKKILEDFQSDTTNWTSWYSKDDQYSREKMSGDLERLSSFYLDRGYVDFSVDSTQVSMSPDKRKMYVVANIKEGEVYSVTDIKLTGDLILKDEDLRKLLQIKSGEIFSRRQVEQSADAITSALSNIGYAFAEVNPIPEINRETREVALNFQVVPGQRVYVRRITFKGNQHTEDQVLRREMRQLEGAWYSQAAIDRSKIRLQRLGYFKTVTIDTPRVPGQEDQVDVAVTIEEQPSGSFTFGVGYSQVQGLITSIALQQNNFFGTGDRVGLTLQRSSYLKTYSISYFEPYLTDDSIGLGYDISHRELDSGQANIANYLTNSDNFSTYVGLPLTESDTLNTRIGLSKTTIRTFNGTTPQVFIDYLRALNHNTFHTGSLEFSWAHDTRNKFYNPTRGSLQTVSFETTLPGSTVEYFKFRYLYSQYIPITDKLTFFGSASLGYGGSYKGVYRTGIDDGQDPPVVTEYGARGLPFFENFFAGGTSDVRGFRDNTLGPVDFTGGFRQPLGGAFKTVATAEIIFPTPFVKENDNSTRLSWFVDVGNVFKDYNSWSAKELRASTGLSFQWRAPIGPIIISFSKPLRKKPGDETESIQFTFGPQF